MTGFWQLEAGRLVLLIAAILFIGIFSGHWVVAVFLPAAIYIIWTLYQLNLLLQWFNAGAKPSRAPECGGAWGELVHHYNRQQQQQARRKRKLKNMLNRFNSTVSALPDATVILNSQLEIEWANAPANDLLRINGTRDLGLPILNLIRTREFVSYLKSDRFDRSLEMKSPYDPAVTLLIQVVRFGKEQRLVLARDISARIEAQRSRKAFVDNASHELKSPLTVIMGYLEAMEMSPRLDDSLKGPVSAALEQSHCMNHIIQDLLMLSRLESDVPKTQNLADFDVAGRIEEVVKDAVNSGKAAYHHFDLDLDSSLSIKIAPADLDSMVVNLIHNAIEHTPRETRVSVFWGKGDHGGPCFRVEDDGPGVAAEHMLHLTERFYRVDRGRNRATGGTGLGLAIVKHSAERYGAQLYIRHALVSGMVFEVVFPKGRLS